MKPFYFRYQDLSRLLDTLGVGAVVVSRERRVVAMNRSLAQMAGVTEAEAVGGDCREMLRAFSCADACRFDDVPDMGATPERTDLDIVDTGGEPHSLTRVIHPLFQPDGTPGGCLVAFQDQSVFKDLLKRVRYEDRRLKMILDNLDTGVLTVDRGGLITFFNGTAEGITGFGREDVLGKPFQALLHDDTRQDVTLLLDTIRDAVPRSIRESWMQTRSGTALPVRMNCMVLKNKDDRVVGGLVTLGDLSLKHRLDTAMKDRYTFYDMVGRTPEMQRIFDIIPVVAQTDATVLIEGATGTGKDLLAKVIHQASPRSANPMVKVNCAALPDSLLESEMFGYVRGAFTGADRDKPGRFQDADGGTIFLDEIGDMPVALQAKLLRVLEDGEFYPLGGRKPVRVDVRIISATNQGLEKLVQEKRFREDLYYRLNVMRMEMPPLSRRAADLPLLIAHILKGLSAAHNRTRPDISENAMEVLLNYTYPGNVRELENILEHALIVCRETVIARRHLPTSLQNASGAVKAPPPVTPAPPMSGGGVQAGERAMILSVLEKYRWRRGETAAALKIDRSTLWRKMRRYGLVSEEGQGAN
jgi:PAS domain S-box-containing protein